MNAFRLASLLPLALTVAQAQAQSDPFDATVAVPPVAYRSSFTGYRGLSEQPVGDWRAANDTVGRIGGWKAYAKEAQDPETPSAVTPPTSAEPPQPAPEPVEHDGHREARQ